MSAPGAAIIQCDPPSVGGRQCQPSALHTIWTSDMVQKPVGFRHMIYDTLYGINIQYLFNAHHLHPTPIRAKARPANESPAFTLV